MTQTYDAIVFYQLPLVSFAGPDHELDPKDRGNSGSPGVHKRAKAAGDLNHQHQIPPSPNIIWSPQTSNHLIDCKYN